MIAVRITRPELEDHGACAAGLAIFDAITRLGGTDALWADWSPLVALWSATAYPEFVGWLRGHGLIPEVSLAGANLKGANLVDVRKWPATSLPEGWCMASSGLVERAA